MLAVEAYPVLNDGDTTMNIKCDPNTMVHLSRNEMSYYFGALGEDIQRVEIITGRPLKGSAFTHSSCLNYIQTDTRAYIIKNISSDVRLAETVIQIANGIREFVPIVAIKEMMPVYKGIERFYIYKNGYCYIVMDYCKEEEYSSKKYTFGKLRSISEALAHINEYLWKFSAENPYIYYIFKRQPCSRILSNHKENDMLKAYDKLSAKKSPSPEEDLFLEYYASVRKAVDYCRSLRSEWKRLPERVLYYDLNLSNAIFNPYDSITGIFDFDSLRIGPRILEFKNPIITTGQDAKFLFDEQSLIEFTRTYHRINNLHQNEIELLPAMFQGAFIDIFHDFFGGKWDLFSNNGDDELLNCAAVSLKNMHEAFCLFSNRGNRYYFKDINKKVDYSVNAKLRGIKKNFSATTTGKPRGMLTYKIFFIYDVAFCCDAEKIIIKFLDKENDREQNETNKAQNWSRMDHSERIRLMRYGSGPAQLRLFDEHSIGAGLSREGLGNEMLSASFGDNVYSIMENARPEKGFEVLDTIDDDALIRISVASLASIKIEGKYLLISQDEYFEQSGIPRYIPIGGAVKYNENFINDLKKAGARDFDGVLGDLRFQIPKRKIGEITAFIFSNDANERIEPPLAALYREMREELTGFEDGASVFPVGDFPKLKAGIE